MESLLSEIESIRDELVADRRWLHQHPETGYDLPETVAYVRGRLEQMGYEVEEPIESGLVCCVGDTTGPCFLLRADMDALPLEEQTGLPFAATNGNMHACGHDFHTAMLLGAAQILKRHEAELPGCVKIVFQPDEEATDPRETLGNEALCDAGVLENPKVGAAAGMHLCPVGVPVGTVGSITGTAFFSVDDVEIEILGTGAHGAQPQKGVDPLNIMSHIHIALQEVLAREVNPYEACVLTFGTMGGGTAANIIPERAHMLGSLRTTNEETRQRLHERITAIVEHTAAAFGGEAHVAFLRGLPTVYNDPALTEELEGCYERYTGRRALRLSEPFSGSDDFGCMSHRVPSTYFLLGSTPEGSEEFPLHSPYIVFDEGILATGCSLLVSAAMGWLEDRAREAGDAPAEA